MTGDPHKGYPLPTLPYSSTQRPQQIRGPPEASLGQNHGGKTPENTGSLSNVSSGRAIRASNEATKIKLMNGIFRRCWRAGCLETRTSGSEGGTQKRAAMHLAGCLPYQYFPLTYAHATWKRLAPFFHLPGRVTQGPRAISVELRPFNDRQLNHDLVALCERVNQASPQLPDGRQLLFSVSPVFDRQQRRPDCTPSSTKES